KIDREIVEATKVLKSRTPLLSLSFFFQAEDGIRDATVTGVQTCALPIYPQELRQLGEEGPLPAIGHGPAHGPDPPAAHLCWLRRSRHRRRSSVRRHGAEEAGVRRNR